MSLRIHNSERGFSLVELTVVLLLITLLASVAVRETAELGFQTRYEQTRERLDMIRQAILSNPKQIINGQQAVSGFVADMGRLPVSVRELIDISAGTTGYCGDKTYADEATCESNGSVWFSFCSNSTYTDQQACETNNALWMGRKSFGFCSDAGYQNNQTQCLANGKQWAHLFYGGWNGPYLSVSENPAEPDALTDGWGNQATAATDQSYGWGFAPDVSNNLAIQSAGKNQDFNPADTGYDEDYPKAQPHIFAQDWLADISGGIKIHIKLPLRDTRQIPPVSLCSDAGQTTKTTCELSLKVWFGGCEDQTYYNKSSCEDATKVWHSCSAGTSVDKTACEDAGAVWYGEGFGCQDQTKTTKTECTAAGKTWHSCTDDGTITTQSACAAAKQLWYGESFITTGDNGGCSDIHYTNKTSCEAATKTWHKCSIAGATTYLGCEAAGGHWLGNGYGCSDQQFSSQATCEANNKVWVESWPRCKKITAPNTELLVPYHNIKTSKDECEGVGGNWKYPRKQVCLNVFYRNNGNLNVATSLPALIEEDGASQTVQFNFAINPVLIPTGQNAIGIYEYDGDCDPVNNPLYPADRQNPIQIDFHPHTILPVINW